MLLNASNPFLTAAILLSAMAFGALLALIAVELLARSKRTANAAARLSAGSGHHSEEEKKRRQDVVVRLMGLYSGVHSADALSDFLNKELERRHELWRVRIPMDGPGEIYDLDPA
jgi:hypothetical protein